MSVSASPITSTPRSVELVSDHLTDDDALSVGEQDQLAGYRGMQAMFGVGTLVAATCFAGFMTLGLELPGAMVNWGQFRH
jgi:hypothetical protein